MNSIQYTIRNIPPAVDRRLRAQAKKTGKSFNQTVVETLSEGAGIHAKPKEYHDLDWFIGSGHLDDNFDEIAKEQRRIDPELWQ